MHSFINDSTLSFSNFFFKLCKYAITIGLCSFLALLWIWSFCFDFIIAYVWLFIIILIICRYRNMLCKLRTVVLIAMIYLLFLPVTLFQYQQHSKMLFAQIKKGTELTFKEKMSIMGLNVVIGILAYPFYPEVSKETLLMIIPCKQKIRHFKSGFFLSSKKIQKALKKGNSIVKWQVSEYNFLGDEARYALALNPCTLLTKYDKGKVHYLVSVNVSYPNQSESILIKYPIKVTVEEGLFAYLQRAGWLHTYRAIWHAI
jgi:hypothetical protein